MINIKLEEKLTQKDIEVIIKYSKVDSTVKRIVSLLKSVDNTIKCTSDNKEQWINASNIYYFESVDKRTFVYEEENVYRTELRLYEALEKLESSGFVRISKSCILNIAYLKSVKSLPSSRIEAGLVNGEKLIITRKFIPSIKEALKRR